MLSFIGFRHEVLRLLQVLSQSTRAYIVNAEGLPGFLVEFNIMEILQKAKAKSQPGYIIEQSELNFKKIY